MAHQISTIIIKSQTASGEEEVEEIELDDATTGALLEQFSVPGNVGGMEGSEVVDMQDILQNIHIQNATAIQNAGDGGGDDGGGGCGTYIYNPDTGEIQMIDVNETTLIGGDEVEVVTVDAERILNAEEPGEEMQSEPIMQFTRDVKTPTMASFEFLKGRKAHAAAPAIPQVSRFKSAPALLRNSRRAPPPVEQAKDLSSRSIAIPDQLSSNKSSSGNVTGRNGNRKGKPLVPSTGRLKQSPQRQKAASTISYSSAASSAGPSTRQIFMINPSEVGQISQFVESVQPMHTIQMKSGSDAEELAAESDVEGVRNQPTYYIYQDINGDQVAELVEGHSSATANMGDQTPNNIIYQFENNSIFLQEGDLTNIGTLTVTLPKKIKPKASRKRTKKWPSSEDVLADDGSFKIRRGQTELKCLEKGCQAVAYNVLELRKHLTTYHDLLFDLDTVQFPSEAAFKEWREQYERERMVSFIYRGGTKKIAKDQAVTYMICHRSGHYKPTMVEPSQRKRKMKPQGSCKIGGYCTAGIKLLKNLDSGEVKMDICHTHYGHPLDNDALPHLRVNPTLRKMILRKFEEGMNFTDVLAYIHHNPDGLEGLRMVDRRAVRNIFDTWKNPVKRTKKTPSTNEVCETVLENSAEDLLVENVDATENNDGESESTNTILPDITNEDELNPDVDKSLVVKKFEIGHDSANVTDISAETLAVVHIIPELSDADNEDEEDSAPVLHIAGEEYEEDQMMDDDSNPPLLIAIDSIKSLKPTSPVSQTLSPSKRKGKRKGKGRKKKPTSKTDETNVKDNRPIIIKTESIKGIESPNSSKALYELRPHRKVEVYKGKKLCNQDLNAETSEPALISTVSDTSNPKSNGEFNVKVKEKHDQARPPVSPSVQEKHDLISPSPIDISSPPHCSVDLTSDQDDFDLIQIHISPEMEVAIDKLHNHGESGPTILLYKQIGDINTKYGGFCRAFREDDFCLIIQTPVQRQIMQMFPKVIGIEILDGPKPNEHDLKLAFVMVLDDYREAIPVAWMVADAMCSRVLNQFFRMLRYHCGELQVQYIMAPKNADIYKTWIAHFSNKPKMLQSEFCARRDLRNLVNRHFPNDSYRAQAVSIIEELITENTAANLKSWKDKLCLTVKDCSNGPNFLRKFEKDWFSRIEEWSFAYRICIPVNLLFVADQFLKLKKFVSFKGTRKLNQSINHILKIGYDKCFLRTKRLFKGDQKFSYLLEKVEKYHNISKASLVNATVSSHSDDENRWTVEHENGVVEQVFHLQSPCNCKIVCNVCKVCMHEYMCSCKDFTKLKVMCAHIHKVHCCRHGIPEETEEDEHQEIFVKTVNVNESEMTTVPGSNLSLPSTEESEIALCEGTEITILNQNQIQELNLSGFLDASTAAGLFRREEGQDMPKIVSITDADTQKVIYDSSDSATPFIFHLTE